MKIGKSIFHFPNSKLFNLPDKFGKNRSLNFPFGSIDFPYHDLIDKPQDSLKRIATSNASLRLIQQTVPTGLPSRPKEHENAYPDSLKRIATNNDVSQKQQESEQLKPKAKVSRFD